MLKIKDIEEGMIIWNNKGEILGITGATLPEEYYENYCVKISGNHFDYMLMEVEKASDEE